MDKGNNIKSKDKTSHGRSHMNRCKDSNFPNAQNLKKNKKKHTKSKENSMMEYDSDESLCNTYASLNQPKNKFLKHLKKRKGKINKNKPARYHQHSDSTSSEQDYNISNKAMGSFRMRCEDLHRKKQRTVINLKPEVTNVAEDLKTMFSNFTSQINQLQSKYLQQDVVTLQGAGDTIFIFNCIISKLKEELTEKQQVLTNSYTHWSTLHKNDRVSNMQYKKWNNNNNLQMRNEEQSEWSTDSGKFSANAHKNLSSKATKNLKKKVQKNIKNVLHQQNIKNDDGESSSETTDMFLSSPEKERNNSLRHKKGAFSKLAKLPEINLIRVPSKSSAVDYKAENKSVSTTKTLDKNAPGRAKKQVQKVYNSQKEEAIGIEYLTDGSSDVSSTCSTMLLYSATSMHHTGKHGTIFINTYEDVFESSVSENASLTIDLNDSAEASLCRCDSDVTIILSTNKMIEFDTENLQTDGNDTYQAAVETIDDLPSNNNLVFKEECIVSDADTLDVEYCAGTVRNEDSDLNKDSVSKVQCVTTTDEKLPIISACIKQE